MTEAKAHAEDIHLENLAVINTQDGVNLKSEMDERMPEAQGRDVDDLPKGYFYSPLFIG